MSDDIKVTDGTILEALNGKIDYDGGNYPGSGLEEYINTHRVGMQLFDTILKDHVLTYEESKGLALQGTYVYKNAVAGSRYGYPDFYAKCLEEYNEASKSVIGYSNITLPTFTANTTDGITVSDSRGNTDIYTLINGVSYKQIGLWSNYWFNIDYKKDTIINSYTIQADNAGSAEYPTAWTLQGSNDGTTFNIIDTKSGITFSLGESKTFTVTTNNTYRQYRLVFSDGLLSSNNGELGKLDFNVSNTITIKKNSNGHLFYDIANKVSIDNFFNDMGTAWFYGIDTENERVFLPRNNYFDQATGSTSEVGQSVEAGLPNIEGGDVYFPRNEDQSRGADGTGALYSKFLKGNTWDYSMGFGGDDEYDLMSVNIDASLSNPIYSNSDTVQPNAVKKLLYICVGNTVSDTSWVDVVTQVANGAKDIEDKRVQALTDLTNKENAGLSALSNASNALRQTQITNCLLEVPQNIKLELNDGVPTLKAGSKVYDGNGLLHTLETDSAANISYSAVQYMFLYEKNRNTLLNFIPSKFGSGDTLPAKGDSTFYIFYLTTDKKVYRLINNEWTSSAGYSFPIALGSGNGSEITSIDQVFNGIGYIGSTIWVDKGVKGLIPNGRNEDGSLNNIEFVTENIITRTLTGNVNRDAVFGLSPDHIGRLYNTEYSFDYENNYIRNAAATSPWLYCVFATYTDSKGVISNFQPKLPFRAVDYNDFNKSINTLSKAYITETYVNGTSWYRIWSDKWCEQGGYSNTGSGVATINFLKAFANTNYIILKTMNTTSTNNVQYCNVSFYSRTTTSAQTKTADVGYSWFAAGYIA